MSERRRRTGCIALPFVGLLGGLLAEPAVADLHEKIVIGARLNPGDNMDVFAMAPDGSGLTNLTEDVSGDATHPHISPDGQSIAFRLEGDGIWFCDASGCERVPGTDGGYVLLDWYDNDTLLYFRQEVTCEREVWVIDTDGTDDCMLIPSPFLGQREHSSVGVHMSPDGTEIVGPWQSGCNSFSTGIYILDSYQPCNPGVAAGAVFYEDPGDSLRDDEPVWSHDSTTICWLQEPASPGERIILCKDRSGGAEITERSPAESIYLSALSPDDQWLLFHYAGTNTTLRKLNRTTDTETTLLTAYGLSHGDWGSCDDAVCGGGPDPVPTVSEWGLVAMTLLMLTAGTLVYAKRRQVYA